ncbi:PREDICTED: uncharacterized protein LOC109592252 [Amphimedon queenslandica]|uniref:Uncharacterized protein n=1 Tax=Amphimedon queenslandica TaxID=400682 RepID=A0AAN0K2B4_AMPQE|nr:PREDICTED: uncharacterized protein LOC109592252 [Amphimedon queenslandica]|eukprot:XP_019863308.1 PREDICTED: uncharacterized protein LOC109592252 [Amphimedon queenslandica]
MLLLVLVAILGIVAILHVKRCLYKCKRASTCMAKKTEARQPLLGKRDDIKTVLYEVLESYHANMSKLFSRNIKEVAKRMHRNDIITNDVYHNPSCDAIIECFKGKLSYIHAHGSNQQNIVDHCNSFIRSIQEMKKGEKDHWVKLADAIKKGWTTKTEERLKIKLQLN